MRAQIGRRQAVTVRALLLDKAEADLLVYGLLRLVRPSMRMHHLDATAIERLLERVARFAMDLRRERL